MRRVVARWAAFAVPAVCVFLQACGSAPRSQPTAEAPKQAPAPPPRSEVRRVPPEAARSNSVKAKRSPASVAPDPEEAALEAALAHLRAGNIVYSTPTRIKSSDHPDVTARIADAAVSKTDLTTGLPAEQKQVTEPIKVSTKMKMTLSGSDFDIKPLSPDEQFVDTSTPTQWQWNIKPRRAGKLRLRFSSVVDVAGLSKELDPVDRDIDVQVDPISTVADFWKGNWQWCIATLTAIGGALWKWLKSRRSAAARV